MTDELLNRVILGNTVSAYLICLGILVVGYFFRNILSKGISKLFFRFFKKFAKNKFSDEFTGLLKTPLKIVFGLLFIYFAFSPLEFAPEWNTKFFKTQKISSVISIIYDLTLVVAITWVLLRTIDFITLVLAERAKTHEDTTVDQLVGFFKELGKFLLVIFAVFFVLGSIFNLNITAIVTGLGLGGLAIALAAQETLSNLLASFIIFLDRPFKAGDLVSVGEVNGTVEKVGFRSTRIRTLDKSLLTVPNKKMIDSPLNNITLSSFRRVRYTLGLQYGTTSAQLKKICDEISTVLKNHKQVDEDFTVKFNGYSASSLDILVVFFVKTNNWDLMMEVKQEVNYNVMEIIENTGAGFAVPVYTSPSGEKK